MARYPIHVPFKHTRSSKPRELDKVRELNRTAAAVERYINDHFAAEPDNSVQVFYHYELASRLHLDQDTVCRVLLRAGGGAGGITVVKGDMDLAIARKAGLNAPTSTKPASG